MLTCKFSSILNPQSSILNPQSSILNPQSSILNPQSSILNPQSSILKPQASSLKPQASSLKPQASSLKPLFPFVTVRSTKTPCAVGRRETCLDGRLAITSSSACYIAFACRRRRSTFLGCCDVGSLETGELDTRPDDGWNVQKRIRRGRDLHRIQRS